MALELILGPANAGKVAELYRRYRSTLEDGAPALLVVPNARAVQRAERELLARGALIGGTVTTFDGAFEIVAARDPSARPLLGTARRRLELDRLVTAANLSLIARSATGARFVDAFGRLIDRLGSGLVDPAAFAAAAAADGPSTELGTLYAAWWDRLDELGASDAGRQRIASVDALARDVAAWDRTHLFVQGFEDLSHAQERLVTLIGERAAATVTMPYEPGRPAFQALRATVGRLAERATIAELEPLADVLPSWLASLERRLYEDVPPVDTADDGSLAVAEAAGTRAEADLVLSEVAGALRGGTPPERIAIVTPRDPSGYAEVLSALGSAAIPHVVDAGSTVGRSPFGFALTSLLAFAWDRDAGRSDLFGFLRSPWSGLVRKRVDFIEGRLRSRATVLAEPTEVAVCEYLGAPVGLLDQLRAAPDPAAAVAEVVRAMIVQSSTLEAREVAPDRRREIAVARAVLDALADLEHVDSRPTREEVRLTIERTRVRERFDPAGRVLVCDVRAARGLDVDVVILLGLEAGGFGSAGEDAFLPDSVRSAAGAGLETADPGDLERYLLYAAVTRARQRLLLVRRVAADDGRPIEPSPLHGDLVRAAGRTPPIRRRGLGDVTFTVDEAPTARERIRAVSRLSALDERRARRIAESDGTARRLRRATHAYRRGTRVTDARVLERLRALDRFNVTSLEKFGDCSSWWYVERFLSPKEIDAAYDARLQGSLAHTALARFYKQLPATFSKERLDPADADRAAAVIGDLVEEAMRGQMLPADTLAARIMVRRLQRDLGRFVRQEALHPSPLVATRFEVGFGGASSAPGLKDGLRIGDFAVTGRIDRIDTDPGFSVHALVQDYKSGKSATGARKLTADGRLQIPLYVLAARELLGMEPIGGLYRALGPGGRARGVLSREADDVLPAGTVSTDLVPPDELWEIVDEAKQAAVEAVRRIRLGDLRHDPRGGSCPWYCPWGEVCRIAR